MKQGMVLTGTEIKSVRAARINLKDGFAQVKMEKFGSATSILPLMREGNIWNQDPDRRRKLLLHKKQIQSWTKKPKEQE